MVAHISDASAHSICRVAVRMFLTHVWRYCAVYTTPARTRTVGGKYLGHSCTTTQSAKTRASPGGTENGTPTSWVIARAREHHKASLACGADQGACCDDDAWLVVQLRGDGSEANECHAFTRRVVHISRRPQSHRRSLHPDRDLCAGGAGASAVARRAAVLPRGDDGALEAWQPCHGANLHLHRALPVLHSLV